MSFDEKIVALGIDDNLKKEIESMEYEAEYFEEDETESANKCIGVLDLEHLIGVARPTADMAENWIEVLDKLTHKGINFDKYNKKGFLKFEKFLMDPNPSDFPVVYFTNNKYYIGFEGLHRLTFAKCLGIKQAKVAIYAF